MRKYKDAEYFDYSCCPKCGHGDLDCSQQDLTVSNMRIVKEWMKCSLMNCLAVVTFGKYGKEEYPLLSKSVPKCKNCGSSVLFLLELYEQVQKAEKINSIITIVRRIIKAILILYWFSDGFKFIPMLLLWILLDLPIKVVQKGLKITYTALAKRIKQEHRLMYKASRGVFEDVVDIRQNFCLECESENIIIEENAVFIGKKLLTWMQCSFHNMMLHSFIGKLFHSKKEKKSFPLYVKTYVCTKCGARYADDDTLYKITIWWLIANGVYFLMHLIAFGYIIGAIYYSALEWWMLVVYIFFLLTINPFIGEIILGIWRAVESEKNKWKDYEGKEYQLMKEHLEFKGIDKL